MTNKQERWVFDDSRYKGHTPGPWLPTFSMVHKVQGWSTWINGVGGRVARAFGRKQNEAAANAYLIADAPNILAEAVRLRVELDEASRLAAERLAENKRLRVALLGLYAQSTCDQVHPEDEEDFEQAMATACDVLSETRALLADTEGVSDG